MVLYIKIVVVAIIVLTFAVGFGDTTDNLLGSLTYFSSSHQKFPSFSFVITISHASQCNNLLVGQWHREMQNNQVAVWKSNSMQPLLCPWWKYVSYGKKSKSVASKLWKGMQKFYKWVTKWNMSNVTPSSIPGFPHPYILDIKENDILATYSKHILHPLK